MADKCLIDAALSKRFVGRIKPTAVVFDQVLGSSVQTSRGLEYTVSTRPLA